VLRELSGLPSYLEANVLQDDPELDCRIVAHPLSTRLLYEPVNGRQPELRLGHADCFESNAVNY